MADINVLSEYSKASTKAKASGLISAKRLFLTYLIAFIALGVIDFVSKKLVEFSMIF